MQKRKDFNQECYKCLAVFIKHVFVCVLVSQGPCLFTEFAPSSRRILNVAGFKWFLMLNCLLIFLCNISSTARDVLERCS